MFTCVFPPGGTTGRVVSARHVEHVSVKNYHPAPTFHGWMSPSWPYDSLSSGIVSATFKGQTQAPGQPLGSQVEVLFWCVNCEGCVCVCVCVNCELAQQACPHTHLYDAEVLLRSSSRHMPLCLPGGCVFSCNNSGLSCLFYNISILRTQTHNFFFHSPD